MSVVRAATEAELPFVVHAWTMGYADSDAALLCCARDGHRAVQCDSCHQWRVALSAEDRRANPPRTYWAGQRRLVVELVKRNGAIVSEADDGLLEGFVCVSRYPHAKIIHYVYVRALLRGHGVAKALCDAAGLRPGEAVLYTHRSRTLREARLPKGWHYDPYELYWEMTR